MNKRLSHEDIFAADDLKRDTVDVPEWGGEVEVRELTAKQKYEVGMLMIGADGKPSLKHAGDIPVMMATYGLGLGKEHFEAIGGKSAEIIERIAEKVQELSGMEAGEVDAAVDFFGNAPNGDSPSS